LPQRDAITRFWDRLYFTLARRYGASLMTLDAKLKAIAENSGIDVIA
jgi:hypothetical protein